MIPYTINYSSKTKFVYQNFFATMLHKEILHWRGGLRDNIAHTTSSLLWGIQQGGHADSWFQKCPTRKIWTNKKSPTTQPPNLELFFCFKLLRPSLATSGWVSSSSSSSGSSSSKSNKGHHYSKSNINSKRRSSMHSEDWLGTLGKSCGFECIMLVW